MENDFERPNWNEHFMLQAELVKLRSNCMIRKVGAVIVKNNRQISSGYNGTPPGIKNCYEGGCERCKQRKQNKIQSGMLLDRCMCNHAEANAIMHCSVLGVKITGDSILYSTHMPCLECTKMAITIGIRTIITVRTYEDPTNHLINDLLINMKLMNKDRLKYWIKLLEHTIE
ncbi:MAG: dCMP deaminase family protein [Thaumarchaeota archaeon]|nr:dCMP deaminase family protein [Nitrososphaerota archaeon]